MKTGEKGILEQYNAIIKDQLAKNIVELVGEHMVGWEFYTPVLMLEIVQSGTGHFVKFMDDLEPTLTTFLWQAFFLSKLSYLLFPST